MNNSSNHTPSAVEGKPFLKDDEWKRIQQNTFTRWVNQHLKKAPGGPKIDNLATDFHDGILLIQLAEVLAQRSLARFNRKPTMRTQKLDNISTVLNFFQKEEHIKIVNIDSSHIADHNLKLILGLMWTLILHYSLSQPIGTAESGERVSLNGVQPPPRRSASSSSSLEQPQHQQSPKKRLLAWVQERVPDFSITNFTSDWSNGIVLGALVDACLGSGAFFEWRQWADDGNDALWHTHRAMQAAEDGLGVAKLITPEELTNSNVDEKSVMTYLSQFPRARPLSLGHLSGLILNPIQKVPCHFHVQMVRLALRPLVEILDPRGDLLLSIVNEIDSNNGGVNGVSVSDKPYDVNESTVSGWPTYKVTFTPELTGEHKIMVYAQNVADPLGPHLPIETVVVDVLSVPDSVEREDDHRFETAQLDKPNYSDMPVSTDHPVTLEEAVDEQGEHPQQTMPTPTAEDGSATTVTRVIKTTTSYTIVQPTDCEPDQESFGPPSVISDMNTSQQQHQSPYHFTNVCSTDEIKLTTVLDDVHLTHRCEELYYQPLELPEELDTVALETSVPNPQLGLRSQCRERFTDQIEAAAMVAVEGHGLQGFLPGQQANFTVDASKIGFSCPKALFVGVVTARGPADKVTVEHVGDGRYEVAYTVQDDVDALVFVKYGKNNVDGSPFSVRPMRFREHSGEVFRAEMRIDDINYLRM